VHNAGVPLVQTLHNFRLHCPQAMYLREGNICHDCLGRLPWPGVLHGCYRNSRTQSAVIATMLVMHRAFQTYQNKVTRYIALNEFCRDKFIEGGLPADRIVIKPNFVNFPPPQLMERKGFLFVGRLSVEKGLDVLMRAWGTMDSGSLKIAGNGPEGKNLNDMRGLSKLGQLKGQQVHDEMLRSSALLLPSISYDSFPRTLVEAYASGLPVIASRSGSFANLVEDGVTGLLFERGNAEDLARKLKWCQTNPEKLAEMGLRARAKYEAEFSETRNYQRLIEIYDEATAAFLQEETSCRTTHVKE
jgi:glycosyltransferase involved in cell wall biosynthesis